MKRVLVPLLLLLPALLVASPSGAHQGDYHQPLNFEWGPNPPPIDVIIVPPEHGQVINGNGVLGGTEGGASELNPLANSYLQAIEDSIADWDVAVEQFGSASLRSRFALNAYVLGRDTVPQAVLLDPEIVVFTDQTKLVILGFAFSGTEPCLVNNSKFFVTSFTYADMYNVNGQEFGHCLGLGHVEGGQPGDEVIAHDVMNGAYADNPGDALSHLHCMSNLNVDGLELAFDDAAAPNQALLAPASYAQINC